MRARVTIYDNTIASLAHLMAVGDLCRRAVNARTVDAYIDRIDGETVVTVTDLEASDNPDELTDLLRTAVSEWTTAPCDIEIEAAA